MYKKVQKTFRWGGPAKLPLLNDFVHQTFNNFPTMMKISMCPDTHYISVYKIWGLYIIFQAINADLFLAVN